MPWRSRGSARRHQEDTRLQARITAIHAQSHGTYGTPRIHAELRESGVRCGRKRVARLMRHAQLVGVHRRHRRGTTRRDPAAMPVRDRVERCFAASAPNRLWTADITALPTREGWLYLAVVLDVYSRRVVGWAMQPHLRTELVLQALEMALQTRRPGPGPIHHSDHGCQYTSIAYSLRCARPRIIPSMGTVGDCYDNAVTESFFASLECELLARHRFSTINEARLAVFAYIAAFYNTHRRHSALGYRSPAAFERRILTHVA